MKNVPTCVYASELAAVLIPSASGDGKFWTDAARIIVTQAIQSLIESNQPWTLCDVVRALKTPVLTRLILNWNGHVAEAIVKDGKVAAGITSTIADAMLPLADAIRESFTKDGER